MESLGSKLIELTRYIFISKIFYQINVCNHILQSALSWDHKEKIEKHVSQKDYSSGFGGKFGVQKDRQDKSAVGWDHLEKTEKHESQKGK